MDFKAWQDHVEIAGVGEVVGIIRRALNYVDPRLIQHGSRVAAVVSRMLRTQGKYSEKDIRDISLVALLHDIGAYKTEEIDEMTEFETGDVWGHSIYGYLFIKNFSPLSQWAEVVLYHHMPWKSLSKQKRVSREIKELAQIVNLADRADIFLEQTNGTARELLKKVESVRKEFFMPEVLNLMRRTKFTDNFFSENAQKSGFELDDLQLTTAEMEAYLRMIVFTIDFRSSFTVTHTIATTGISFEIAKRLGMPEPEPEKIALGALLHDLGKIAIPVEILEYPGPLSIEKMDIMRTHVDLTEKILGNGVTEEIKNIALRHHEKLDGSGYPRRLKAEELTQDQRIVAVADIVSALNGERSYKEAFSRDRTINIISDMGIRGLLDDRIVNLVIEQFDGIMAAVMRDCDPVIDAYDKMRIEYDKLMQELQAL